MREIRNAKITSTNLTFEEPGCFSCWLMCEWGFGSQGFGGYVLDAWDEKTKRRYGTAFGCEFLMQVLKTVGVSRWEDLLGKYVRIDHDYGNIYRLGHIIEDKWFDPKALAEAVRAGTNE